MLKYAMTHLILNSLPKEGIHKMKLVHIYNVCVHSNSQSEKRTSYALKVEIYSIVYAWENKFCNN